MGEEHPKERGTSFSQYALCWEDGFTCWCN